MSNIITTSDFQARLPSNIAYDSARATGVVNAVNQYIETQTNRCWGETKTITEQYDYRRTLWLRKMDIQSITQIQVGWPGQTLSTLPPSGYFLNPLGRVTMFWQSPNGNNQTPLHNDFIHITYTYGVENVPDDLKEAALGVAIGLYNWSAAGGKEIVSSAVGNYRIETIGAVRGSGQTGATPYQNAAEHHFLVIQSYKKKRL